MKQTLSRTGWTALISLMTALCLTMAFPVFAGTEVKDTFEIETPEIKKRKKGPPKFKLVTFTHQKHAQDYKISCGDCHHDNENTPLNLKPGDEVQRCVACHTKLKKDKKNKDK